MFEKLTGKQKRKLERKERRMSLKSCHGGQVVEAKSKLTINLVITKAIASPSYRARIQAS
jgi:hypothetical protein